MTFGRRDMILGHALGDFGVHIAASLTPSTGPLVPPSSAVKAWERNPNKPIPLRAGAGHTRRAQSGRVRTKLSTMSVRQWTPAYCGNVRRFVLPEIPKLYWGSKTVQP